VAVAAEAAVSRLRFWSIALNGFSQHPWTGLGIEHFAQRYRAALPEDQRGNVVPVHPHSLALAVAFDAGVPGLLGLVLLLTGIVASMRSAPRGSQLRHLALGTLVALLVANLFDFTFFHSSLFYPLCALAGWCRPQEQRSRIP
jgi:O-antigen ligase